MSKKSFWYQKCKKIALIRNTVYPPWRTSTIQSLKDFNDKQIKEVNDKIRDIETRLRIRLLRNKPFLQAIREQNDYFNVRFTPSGDRDADVSTLRARVLSKMKPNTEYYFSIQDDNGHRIKFTRGATLNKDILRRKEYYNLVIMMEQILNNKEEYNISANYITLHVHKVITENPP